MNNNGLYSTCCPHSLKNAELCRYATEFIDKAVVENMSTLDSPPTEDETAVPLCSLKRLRATLLTDVEGTSKDVYT